MFRLKHLSHKKTPNHHNFIKKVITQTHLLENEQQEAKKEKFPLPKGPEKVHVTS